ncbi:phage tail tip lysozyme [Bradyrhizobium valentinum]|uniref:Phage tail lysozyme domain-containing protein n=1 Tax=Bradyrhizobium valentinum TaxID=1518501 RepID=A0A0R3LWA5_9BRAD|nr:phage tail tip lysozyme [Bradyrhizobium valentinum]KRR11534.1 hypothetical protein CP49_18030 [Bradyrhizobium valentinum]
MTTGAARREVDGLRGSLRAIGNEVRGATLPALSSLGLAGGGVALAVVGIAGSVKSYAEKIQDLGIASKELQLSVRNIRAFEAAAGAVRINPEQAMQGLATFRKNAEDFQLKIGSIRDELAGYGAGDVVEAIRKTREPLDQLRITFERMEHLQKKNPVLARRYAEAMFGSAQFARLGWEEFRQSFQKVGELTAEEIARAEKANRAFLDLGRSVEKLKQSAAGELLPGMTKAVDGATSIVESIGKLDAFAEKWSGRKGGVYGFIFGHPQGEEGGSTDPMNDHARGMKRGPSGDLLNRSQRPGDYRLPGFRDDRRKEDTEQGTKKGVFEGLKEFFQLSSAQASTGGFMNASLGGGTLSNPRFGGVGGQWGNQQYPNRGGSDGIGASNGQSAPAAGLGTVPKSVRDLPAAKLPSGQKGENAQRLYNELRRLGHSHEQASAALGHAQHESGFNPGVVGDKGTAFGFFQHRGSRWAKAQKMAAEAGTTPFSPEAAARHFDHELRTNEKAAGRNYFASKSTHDAVTALNAYERFAGWQRGQPGRYSSAEGFAKKMRDTNAPPPSVVKARPEAAPDFDDRFNSAFPNRNQNLPKPGSFEDRWSGITSDRIDQRIGNNNMTATGTVNLSVTAPTGTKVDSKADGLFQSTNITRTKQMPRDYGERDSGAQ